MPRVPRITSRLIDSLEPSLSGHRHYYVMEAGGRDSLRGFGLQVLRTSVQYIVRYRRKPYRLGRVDLIPLEQAREAGRTLLLQLQIQRTRPELTGQRKTVAELADLYLQQVVATRNKPRTLEEYRRLWRLHLLPRFGSLRLPQVTPELVLRMKHELSDRPVAANRALQQLAAAFAFAIRLDWVIKNPAAEGTIERYTEAPETRTLESDHYRRLGAALREAASRAILPPRTIAAIRLLLLTGARPHEILSAELAWLKLGPYPRIDLPQAKGDRPGRRPKGRSLWLSPSALEIIHSIPRPPSCRWLIPGDDPEFPLGSIDKAWSRICQIAGIEGVTPKSCRHSYRSAGPDAGVAREHMMELLGHASSKMTDEVYWHASPEGQTRAAEAMAEHLASLLDHRE